ncbi:hypothetical protein ACFY05_25810 [Microtetraspora fusca]|uniref:Uncharacterized protein n=1 Tax=Microtetraspora fusca TaxID=1997 RepID=A0ABW6VAB1_MICFU
MTARSRISPEVSIVTLPFLGVVTGITPVFSRKPIFGCIGLVPTRSRLESSLPGRSSDQEAVVAFGRTRKADEPPVEPVAWTEVWEFVVGRVERPETPKRKKATTGAHAVRVPRGGKLDKVLAPCAYVASGQLQGLPAAPGLTLFEDAAQQRLLCYVAAPQEVDGERHHVVHDGRGQVIGTIKRIPPKRPFRHTWRIEQPGYPEIMGRNEWASGGVKDIAGRAAERLLHEALDGLFSSPGDSDQGGRPRSLEWRSGEEIVMTSEGSAQVRIRKEWLDRRLAFAFALIGDV